MKVVSWNVNGLRALVRQQSLQDLFKKLGDPDVVCVQETKISEGKLLEYERKNCGPRAKQTLRDVPGYRSFWAHAQKEGYSGVVTFIREGVPLYGVVLGMGHRRFDEEGRVVQTNHGNLTIFNCYFPNTGRGGERVRFKHDFCVELQHECQSILRGGRHVLVVGDINVCHADLDAFNAENCIGRACFLDEERNWLSEFLADGFVDTFRVRHEGQAGTYTWWDQRDVTARPRNRGWRLDYGLADVGLDDMAVRSSEILPDVMGSDHCPISVMLEAESLPELFSSERPLFKAPARATLRDYFAAMGQDASKREHQESVKSEQPVGKKRKDEDAHLPSSSK